MPCRLVFCRSGTRFLDCFAVTDTAGVCDSHKHTLVRQPVKLHDLLHKLFRFFYLCLCSFVVHFDTLFRFFVTFWLQNREIHCKTRQTMLQCI
nr:MAG TPA: hypothetical protein [Caudoviricetes sp.]